MRRPSQWVVLAALVPVTAMMACGTPRPVTGGRTACASVWEGDGQVAALLQDSCARCHSGQRPAGGYDVTTYNGTLTDQAGNTMATAGSADSPLLLKLTQAPAGDPHAPAAVAAATTAKLTSWVVDCRVGYSNNAVHPLGIANPADPDFHGTWIRSLNYSFDDCRVCHGSDLAGGAAKVSCFSCHTDGPTAFFGNTCTGCHGQPPKSGAHLAHYQGLSSAQGAGRIASGFDCTACHVKPTAYTDPGHIFDADGGVIGGNTSAPVAVIAFGTEAAMSYGAVTRTGPPAYDKGTGTCTNVYCHGGAFAPDSAATSQKPKWTGGGNEALCGTCHGLPPATASHQSTFSCGTCHPLVAGDDKKLVNPALHVDGRVELGDDKSGCAACHGSGMYGAPPRDLEGNTDHTAVGVGAHAAHLGAHLLRGPVACGDCHVVPAKVDSPGHIDHAGINVFPSTSDFTGLAIADGAQASWAHNTATCTNVYCHGGGTKLGNDMSTGLHRNPLWTGTTAEVYCGSCHGVPPVDKNHDPSMRLQGCAKCHGKTIDGNGNFIFTNTGGVLVTSHIDGVVDGN